MAILGVIAMSAVGLVSLSTQSARAAIETRSITETGIKFVGTEDILRNANVGDTFTYEDVTGVGSTSVDRIKAKVTITGISGSRSRVRDFVLSWYDYSDGAYMSPTGSESFRTVTVERIQYRYAFREYADDPIVWSAPIEAAATATSSATIRMEPEIEYFQFQYRLQISDSTWRSGTPVSDEFGPILHDEFGTPSPFGNFYVYEEISEDNDRTWIDIYDVFSPTEVDESALSTNEKADFSYLDGLQIGDELRMPPSDPEELDENDFLYMDVSKQHGTDLAEITFTIEFFDASDNPVALEGLFVNAYDIDRLQTVEFENFGTYEVTRDTNLSVEEVVSGATTRLVFRGSDTNARTTTDENHSYRQARVKVFFETTEVITIKSTYPTGGQQSFDFGAGYPWAEQEATTPRRERQAPPVLAPVGPDRAKLIVGGFDHNSRKLTDRMQARIDKWLAKHPHLSTLSCTGFTSLPKRPTDVVLSENRGITACKYSKSERPELKTSVSQGIEDPRPGADVRRVRLVLTK
jgi:hypothetical protein